MGIFKDYISKRMVFLIVPIVAMIIVLGIDSFFPYLQKIFVDDILLGSDKSKLGLFFGVFLGLSLLRGILGYIKEFLFDKFSLNVSKEIRMDLFKKIQSFEFSFFDSTNTGELMSRIGEDVDIVWETISYGLRLLIEGIILFIISVTIMMSMSPSLTIICLVILLPVGVLAILVNKKFHRNYSKISDKVADINLMAQQDIAGIRLVKAFAREKYETEKFLKVNKDYYDLNITQAKILSNFLPVIDLLTNLTPVAMIIYGGYLVIKGNITMGTLLAFSSYILNLSFCVKNIGGLVNMMSQNRASMDKIFNILKRKPQITSMENSYNPDKVKGEIEFKNVSFRYNEEEVLKKINLKIPAGSTVAIMGETGCGKSSILSLIGRHYDVSSGELLIDGVNVKKWNLDSLRENMAVVFQDTFLFSDSIKDNIDFGGNKSEDEIIEAAKDSCAYDFIKEMPEGFETEVGERGLGLSGGQKQRLAIARALVRKTPILILDDATSALDMETEFNVLKNLSKKQDKATTFIIAHRISGVKDADIILFMKDGEIVEMGDHESLLKKKGYYYSVYCHQFQDLEFIQ
ncbi:ABC transporter ATP-binding protein [Clostridium perfringens]|uniref:ABC transporter, permease/ATP-binding protein n=1 Tax=Clostridium perfringens (strain ATCC 13124 / DSM 756 / JCM 1290 / NCIMB 6125 / NCTC 8237 / Type A) TaxID=195103 RepID=A0A0H2YU18_CLOP1|nr:ABC transporter ATP-binding protein [Clostridium perfringens]ABG84579.1 ABC transporter, permease/ATP-binding protein [Clostridium perfringens ATCC 13124]EGT0684969.1 ABC transporter ATP-binding protein [Clostridium perfringens]EGT0687966.1 ABC transporter ATP-binding protein [Clostridium perfringens]EGT0690107.1 ABC transporter ATP-binding protein [Clostridium perfringens]EGT4140433.1 ABC transporter ATP-binding protein [Clostridium perfringens]